MSTRNIVVALSCSALWMGCTGPEEPQSALSPETQEILENLLEAGFPAEDLSVVGGRVLTGGDAEVSLAASREMLQSDGSSSEEQYRTTNQIGAGVRNSCVNGAAFVGNFSTATDLAIENYNALALRWRMTRTSGNAAGCDAVITGNMIAGNGGVAGFPANGLPFGAINIGVDMAQYNVDVIEHVMTHELGHCIGFRHTDFYNRTISCGQGGNEGDGGVGAIHIPNTPVDAVFNGSVMNSCFNAGSTGEWTGGDLTAVGALYGSPLTWGAATTWAGFFSNLLGWGGSAAMWSSIEYPDVNGDGQKDVCGRSTLLGIQCGVSTGTTFNLPTVWGVTFTDLLGWSNENTWGTIQYPDVNGDGRADVCGRSTGGIVCALSTANLTFGVATTWTTTFGDNGGWNVSKAYWGTVRFPDLNGDGKDDVCARGAAGVQCELSTGTAFNTPAMWSTRYSDANNWGSSEGYWGTIQYIDLNGDNKDDICGRAGGGLACGLSTGTTFTAPTTWNANFSDAAGWGGSKSYYGTIRYVDVTGDGKLDVCARGGGGIVCGPSTGASFAGPQAWNSDYSDAFGWGGSESYWGTIGFPDVNGDGRADVCGRGGAGITCALSNGVQFISNALRGSAYGDGAGWFANENQWRTIRYPDLNNDKKADVCGRSANGVQCSK